MKKQRWKESEKRREEEKKSEKRKRQKTEDAGTRKGSKVAKHCVFPMICGSGGSESRLAKVAGAEPSGQTRDEKLQAVVARSTFSSQNVKSTTCSDHFCRFRCGFVWQAQGIVHLVNKTWGFCGISKHDGRRGTFAEDLQRCIFCGRRSTRDMFIRDVRRSGRWFPEHGCILEHQVFRFPKMILRDRCSTSYDLASKFRGRCSTLDRWQIEWKNCKTHWHEALSSALNFPFLKEVSQNCVVFDVVNFQKWGSLAVFSFLTLSSSKIEEVSQNCCVLMLSSSRIEEVSQHSFVFKLADRWMDGWMDR